MYVLVTPLKINKLQKRKKNKTSIKKSSKAYIVLLFLLH